MKLELYQPVQENDYYFKGYVSLAQLSQLFSDYPFSEETLEKATIHRRNMIHGISPFSAVLRIDPDSQMESFEDTILFTCDRIQIRNGASKIAAICQLEVSQLDEGVIPVSIFLATEEKLNELSF